MNKLDLLTLFPNNRACAYGTLGHEIAAVTPPVQSALLAATARAEGLSAALLDADAEGLDAMATAARIQALSPSLVAISTDQVNSGDVTKMQAAEDTIRALHAVAPEIPVLLDGVLPSAYPEKMLRREQADFICCGEGYRSIPALAKWLKGHGGHSRPSANEIPGIWSRVGDEVIPGGRAPMVDDVDSLPDPAWDWMPPSRYRAHHWHCFDCLDARAPYAAIYTNYGCPFNCSYCSVNIVAGKPNLRYRSVDRVMGELTTLVEGCGVRHVRLLDNVFTIGDERVEELCDRIIAKKWELNFWAYARVGSLKHPELLKKLRRAGVRWLAYGFESANARVRGSVHKDTEDALTEQTIEWTRAADISIVANFIFGLPEDDMASMQETFDMAKSHLFEWINIYCTMAYPGTRLYDERVAAGEIMPENWSAYSHYSPDARPRSTKYVDWKDVVRFRDAAFQEYCSAPAYLSMLERRFGPAAPAFVRKILEHPLKRNFS